MECVGGVLERELHIEGNLGVNVDAGGHNQEEKKPRGGAEYCSCLVYVLFYYFDTE